MPPKSILKNKKTQEQETRERYMPTALHHANLIQSQKDLEKAVLHAVLELIELPTDPQADPAAPAEQDAATFKRLVSLFQPGHYDELLEERHASKMCGYVLCPRPLKKPKNSAPLTITSAGIVPQHQVQLWCSQECARRAMYIKVQLNEEPAPLRAEGQGAAIELMPEKKPEALKTSLPLRPKQAPKTGGNTDIEGNMAKLALERGAKDVSREDHSNLVQSEVVEKENTKRPDAPVLEKNDQVHHLVEGHSVRELSKEKGAHDDQEDDDDWD